MKTEYIKLRIAPEVKASLRRIAAEKELNMSAISREALREYIARNPAPTPAPLAASVEVAG